VTDGTERTNGAHGTYEEPQASPAPSLLGAKARKFQKPNCQRSELLGTGVLAPLLPGSRSLSQRTVFWRGFDPPGSRCKFGCFSAESHELFCSPVVFGGSLRKLIARIAARSFSNLFFWSPTHSSGRRNRNQIFLGRACARLLPPVDLRF